MSVFWLVAAMFVAGALLLLVPGLLRPRQAVLSSAGANLAVHRDQLREAERDLAAGLIGPERFEQAVAEIHRRTLEDAVAAPVEPATAAPARRTALVLALGLPLAVLGTYLQLGRPDATAPPVVAAPAPAQVQGQAAQHSISPEQIQQRATALAERLKAEPGNADGWLMLGRSYTALGRYGDAAMAYRRAVALLPPNPGLLADLADLSGMAQGKRLAGEPARLIQQALDIDPKHVKSLALAGSVAFELRDYGAARDYWTRLLAVVPADSDLARSMQNSIKQASALESGAAAPAAGPSTPSAGAQAAPAQVGATSVSGQVQLAPALAARLASGDTLFVFARAEQGPRMPLAIIKRPADGRPFDFTLDDSMAMAPNLRLSGFAKVNIGARISRSGQATPQPGDLLGQSEAVSPGARGVRVLIDRVQP
jgi:cytochrome c-type biogenesis protein CcmH